MRSLSPVTAYIRSLFAPESKAAQQARIALETHFPEIAGISVGAEEGKLLQLLIHMNGIRKLVEIGSLTGYSGMWMAQALPEDGELHLIERNPEHAALIQSLTASHHSPVKIKIHQGAALEVLPRLQGPFDMVFIDADKPGYPAYLDWAELNIRKGGLIIGDNTLLFGHVMSQVPPQGQNAPSKAAWSAMREFNARLADPKKYCSVLIPTQEGMTVALKLT